MLPLQRKVLLLRGVDELGELIGNIEGRNAEVFTFTPASDTTTFSIENPYGITDKCFVFLLSTNKNQKQREILFQAVEFFKKNVYYPSKCYEIRRNTTFSDTNTLDGRTSFKGMCTERHGGYDRLPSSRNRWV